MKLFQKMSHKRARCLLCPRYCELEYGDIGACHARINRGGEIVLKDWGAISSMAVEPIEKKPFKHFLPGTKILSIGGWGCNLMCLACENWEISQSESHEAYCLHSNVEIVEMAKEKDCPSVCMTYNEPTIAIEYLIELANLCHENDLKFIIKTNAYINEGPWEEVCKVVDAMSVDYKGAFQYFEDVTQCRYVNYSGKIDMAHDYGIHVELSVPILPGYENKDGGYFWPLESFKQYDIEIPCHLFKVNPAYLMIDSPTTSDEDIKSALADLSEIFSEIHV